MLGPCFVFLHDDYFVLERTHGVCPLGLAYFTVHNGLKLGPFSFKQ